MKFQNPQYKKRSFSTLIIVVIAIIVLFIGGYVLFPKFLKSNDSSKNELNNQESITSDSSFSEVDNNSEQTTTANTNDEIKEETKTKILDEAKKYADENDYKSAISVIKGTQSNYGDDTDYIKALNSYSAAYKTEALEAAEEKALEGDYVSAISIINEVKESEGENKEFTNAYITYCEKYKTEVIKTADELAENGDYPVAIQKVVEATAVIEDDDELREKITSYEDAYVSSVIKKVDKLIKDGKYEEATKLIENTPNEISEKDVFQSKIAEIEEKKAVYLLDVIKPHYTNDYKEFDNGKAKMGGIERCKGFSIKVYGWDAQSCAFFNLEGKYKKLSGMIGHLDGEVGSSKKKTWKAWIYGDDDLLFECEVKPGALPVEFKIDVSDKKNIEFRTGEGNNWDTDEIGFAEIKLYK